MKRVPVKHTAMSRCPVSNNSDLLMPHLMLMNTNQSIRHWLDAHDVTGLTKTISLTSLSVKSYCPPPPRRELRPKERNKSLRIAHGTKEGRGTLDLKPSSFCLQNPTLHPWGSHQNHVIINLIVISSMMKSSTSPLKPPLITEK